MNFYEETDRKFKEIQNLEKNLKAASSTIASSVKNEDVAIFIGSTKSGKSTLINYLIDNKLLGVKDEKLRKVCIKKADPNQRGPEIGRGPTSETVIPTRWSSPDKLPGLALWDSPGFEDNRSSSQDITNAFYIHELFKNIRTAKVVLVTDFNDILNDRINSFLSLLSSVENLFKGDLIYCFPSIVVIFTKVPSEIDDEPVNVDFVTDILEHKILSESSLEISRSSLEFVRHLVQNDEQIGLFRRAVVGPITSNVDAGVVRAIRSAGCIVRRILMGVSPSVSSKSKVFLHEIRNDLESNGPLDDLGSIAEMIFTNQLNHFRLKIHSSYGSSKRLHKLSRIECYLEDINRHIETLTNPNTSFRLTLTVLKSIDNNFLFVDDLIERKNMMDFIDSLLGLENAQLIMRNFRYTMKTVKYNASEVMLDLQTAKREVEELRIRRRIEKKREEKIEKREEIARENRRIERELRKKQREREEERREERERQLRKEREERERSEESFIDTVVKTFNPFNPFNPFSINFK